MENKFDIVFIGSGPAGFTGAIRAAQLGAKVAVVELGYVGGVCLNRGCIPSKSMLRSSQAFADLKENEKLGIFAENASYDFCKMLDLRFSTVEKIRTSLEKTMKSLGIEIIKGFAKIDKQGKLSLAMCETCDSIEYKHLVIATGSMPRMLPDLPADKVLNSDTMLALQELPNKTLIIGSGAIGIEWARILKALDKQVCLIELADKLSPAMDESISDSLARILRKQRIEFYTSTSIEKIEDNKAILSNKKEIEFDKILVAIGRVPNFAGMQEAPFEKEKGFIKVNENFQTNLENIYAIGDITGKQMLAHTAAAQAVRLVEYLLLGKKIEIDYTNIPAIIYGKPELATVGKTEQALKAENAEYKVSKLPLTISAKAFIDSEFDGMVKVLSQDNIIVGASVVANDASSLLQILSNAISLKTPLDKLNEIVYAHPTTTEAISEAILNLEDKAIFVPKKVK